MSSSRRKSRSRFRRIVPLTACLLALSGFVAFRSRRRQRASMNGIQNQHGDLHPGGRDPFNTATIGGLQFAKIDEAGVVHHILEELESGRGGVVVTPNVDILRQLKDPALRAVVEQAELVVADGMPIVWASAITGDRLPARVAGSQLIWTLSAALARSSRSVFLVGGAPGVPDRAARALAASSPGLVVSGCLSPRLGFEDDPVECRAILEQLRDAAPSVVFVALGFPKQERFAETMRRELPSTWFLGCGGSLDMAAGDVRRASPMMQRLGAEWLVRLSQEPRRLARRYLVDDAPYAVRLISGALLSRVLHGPVSDVDRRPLQEPCL